MSLQVKLPFGRASAALRSCTTCGYSTRHRVLYDKHVKRCATATQQLDTSSDTEHKLSAQPHVVNRNYRCKQCNFTSTKSKMFLYHQKDKHRENINIFPCDLCDYASRYKCKVLRHRKFIHPKADDLDANDLMQEDEEILALEAQEERDNMSALEEIQTNSAAKLEEEEEDSQQESPQAIKHQDFSQVISVDKDIQIPVKTEVSSFDDEIEQENLDLNGNEMDQQTKGLIAELTTTQPQANENAFDYIRKLSDSPGGPVFQCKLCTYTNMQKWKVANHVRSFHMKKKLFKCPLCDFITGRKIEFCIHKTKHSNKKVFSCEECGYRTIARANYDRHMANHKADSPVKCSLCTYSSTGEAAIQRHMQEYHSGGIVPPLEGMSRMVGPASPSPPPSDRAQPEDIACPRCDLVFKSESKLKIHLISHSNESLHQCPLCSLRYKRTSDLNRHMKRKHNTRLRDFTMSEQDEPLNLCVKRPRLQNDEDQPLDLSVKPIAPTRRFSQASVMAPENLKCSHCSYLAKWPSDLHRHMLVHSVEKRFKCTYCHRRYKYKFDLNMHLRKMHKVAAGRTKVPLLSEVGAIELSPQDAPIVMPGNSLSVSTVSPAPPNGPQDLSEMSPFSHDGAESFCSTSSSSISPASVRSFNVSPASSHKPVFIHPLRPSAAEKLLKSARQLNLSPVGKFKCEFCPYLGACRSEVDRHMRLHTGEKPYSCLFCTYKSHWKGDMKRHIQKHHGDNYNTENEIHEIMLKSYQPERAFENLITAPSIETKPMVTNLRPSPSPTRTLGPDSEASSSMMIPPNAVVNSSGEVTASQLKSSSGSESSPKKHNICPYCPFVCEAPSKLKCHMEIHENLKRFKCAYCGKRSNWTWDVRKHIKKEHPGIELNVIVLSEEEARTTLADYLQTHHKSPVRRALEFGANQPEFGASHPSPDHSMDDDHDVAMEGVEIVDNEPKTSSSHLVDMSSVILDTASSASEILEQFLAVPSKESPPVSVALPASVALPFTSAAHTNAPFTSTSFTNSSYSASPAFTSTAPSFVRSRIATERFRPYKCSKCGKRSNWRWDLKKHIRSSHPYATLIEMSDREARAQWPPEKPKVDDDEEHRVPLPMGPPSYFTVPLPEAPPQFDVPTQVPLTTQVPLPVQVPLPEAMSVPSLVSRPSSGQTKYVQQVDLKRLKKFKCHLCPYRSNYRSDIGRHSKRLHRKAPFKVVVLDDQEAASTLQEYKDAFGHKKFVLSPARSRSPQKPVSGSLPETKHKQQQQLLMLLQQQRHNCEQRSSPPQHKEQEQNIETGAPEQMDMEESDAIADGQILQEVKIESGTEDLSSEASSSKVKVWKCSRCDFRSKNKHVVLQHLKCHPKVKVFKCKMCGEESDYRNSIYRHIRSQHLTTDYSAGVIESVVFVEANTDAKSPELKPKDTEDTTVYRCKLCGQTSNYRAGILRHAGEMHKDIDMANVVQEVTCTNEKASEVTQEEEVTSQEEEDEKREEVTQDDPKDNGTSKKLKCNVCPYETSKAGMLNFHKAYHKRQVGHKHKCKYCPYYVSAPRLLHQHIRLHEADKSNSGEDNQAPTTQHILADDIKMETDIPPIPKTPPHETNGGRKHFSCDQCPFMCRNKNDFIYHKQFHKEKPSAPFKCQHCDYWVAQRRLLAQHNRVHAPEYAINFKNGTAVRGVCAPAPTDPVVTSPAKSESECDAVEMAHIKQQIIASKIYSTPISPEKFECRGADKASPSDMDDTLVMDGYLVNKSGHLLKSGALRKLHKCTHCPYTNVRATNLRLHESMHGSRAGKDLFKCPYCDYHVGNKGLLSHHVKVHSNQYQPGRDEINDIEYSDNEDRAINEGESEDDSADKTQGDHPTENQPDKEDSAKNGVTKKVENGPKVKKDRCVFDYPPIVDVGPQLDAGSLPCNTEFYVKFDDSTGDHVLERVSIHKWCCEKCPYATMKRMQFERHVLLHSSKQKYVCDYCDYSVPAYHLVLQHKKLHLQPNPNLLSLQSIANLHRLPEVPADLAAASNFPANTTDPSSQAGVHDHLKLYENSDAYSEPKKLYRCDRCPYTNVKRENLLAHLKFHMVQSSIHCSYCDYSVSKEHLLVQHIKVHFTNALDLFDSPSKSNREDDGLEQEDKSDKSVKKEQVQKKTSKETSKSTGELQQPEYIDISELSHVDKKSQVETNNNQLPKVQVDRSQGESKAEKRVMKVGREERRSRKGVPVKRVCKGEADTNGADTVWICQYCDRAFAASEALLRHEMQHLIGNHF